MSFMKIGLIVLCSLLGFSRRAHADEGRGTAFTGRLLLGPGYLSLDTAGGNESQHGPVISTQLDLGARLTELLGVHAVLFYEDSKWIEVERLRDKYSAGGFGVGAGVDVRVLSLLAGLSAGWQSTSFTTNRDPEAPDGAKAGFVLARAGYVLPVSRGLGIGGHLFGRYFWSRHDEQGGTRYDPRGYTLGALLSFGFDGDNPLFD